MADIERTHTITDEVAEAVAKKMAEFFIFYELLNIGYFVARASKNEQKVTDFILQSLHRDLLQLNILAEIATQLGLDDNYSGEGLYKLRAELQGNYNLFNLTLITISRLIYSKLEKKFQL